MSVSHLSDFWLIIIFLASSVIIWIAGNKISFTTDIICDHFKFGEALGGMVFLAIVTNLPEIAITSMAAYNGHLEIAASNILGGIAIQTVVLAMIDAFGVGKKASLTYKASSVELIIEGIILIYILTLVMMGKYISPDLILFHVTPIELMIVVVWFFGIYLVSKKIKLPRLTHEEKDIEEEEEHQFINNKVSKKKSISIILLIFISCATLTLLAGWLLEISGEALASRFGMSGAIFGATILAAATALPELSTGIASAKIKDYRMAMSDIIGGNAFLPVLFVLASLISGKAILPNLNISDMYLTGLGILLTSIYIIGLILKIKKQHFRMGLDSIAVLIVYVIGIIGLLFLV